MRVFSRIGWICNRSRGWRRSPRRKMLITRAQTQQQADPSPPAPTAAESAPTKKTYTVPAGTKILLQLRSGINTRSAKARDGVWLGFVLSGRCRKPGHDSLRSLRAGSGRPRGARGTREGQGTVGYAFYVHNLPQRHGRRGSRPCRQPSRSRKQSVKDDERRNNRTGRTPDKGPQCRQDHRNRDPNRRNCWLPLAVLPADINWWWDSRHRKAGLAAVRCSLFTRGADVNIDTGTQVEMVLQRPLLLEEANLSGTAPNLEPAAGQPKPLGKPNQARVLCPREGSVASNLEERCKRFQKTLPRFPPQFRRRWLSPTLNRFSFQCLPLSTTPPMASGCGSVT